MALKLEIYLPNETVDRIQELEDLVLAIGDLLSISHGNAGIVEETFDLEGLNSFIIISNEPVPAAENYVDEDAYLIIPIESEKDE